MALSIIALISSLTAFVISIVFFVINIKHDKANNIFTSKERSYATKNELLSLRNRITDIEVETAQIVKKYEEEKEKEELETRQKHWKSFNKWKMQKDMSEQQVGQEPICIECYNECLELDVNYKELKGKSMYSFPGYIVKEDYPLSAEQKCTVCGHVNDKWKYEG